MTFFAAHGLRISHDLSRVPSAGSDRTTFSSDDCGHFEGPIESVDVPGAQMKRRVRDLQGVERMVHNYQHVSPVMLQRVEIMRKEHPDQPVAVNVGGGRVYDVQPLQSAQALSVQSAYQLGIVPEGAFIQRVNPTLREVTHKGCDYTGKLVGATLHHFYLQNFQSVYEAHLKCLFPPDVVAHCMHVLSSGEQQPYVEITYAGPQQTAGLRDVSNQAAAARKHSRTLPAPQPVALPLNSSARAHRLALQKIERLGSAMGYCAPEVAVSLLHLAQANSRVRTAIENGDPVHGVVTEDLRADRRGATSRSATAQELGSADAVSECGSFCYDSEAAVDFLGSFNQDPRSGAPSSPVNEAKGGGI